MSTEIKAEVVIAKPAVTEQEGAQLRLRGIADGIFEQNMRIMSDATYAFDIDPELSEPPVEWMRELGPAEAKKRHRIAMSSLLPAKDAPVALQNARAIVVGCLKSKAMEQMGPRTINVTAVQMTEPQIRKVLADEFPVLDVD